MPQASKSREEIAGKGKKEQAMRTKLQRRLLRDLTVIQDCLVRHADNLDHDSSRLSDFRYAHRQLEIILELVQMSLSRMRDDRTAFPVQNGFEDEVSIFADIIEQEGDEGPSTADLVVKPVD